MALAVIDPYYNIAEKQRKCAKRLYSNLANLLEERAANARHLEFDRTLAPLPNYEV